MDATRFDRFTRYLATSRLTRRRAVITGGAMAAAAALPSTQTGPVLAQATPMTEATPATPSTPQPDSAAGNAATSLFVQTAESGTFTATEKDGVYTLVLVHGLGQTIAFSDRPQRLVQTVPTGDFLAELGFSTNPPNAALVTQDGDLEVVIIVELTDPSYDAATDKLTYTATLLGEYAGAALSEFAARAVPDALPEAFSAASLFIDSGDACTPRTGCSDGAICIGGACCSQDNICTGPNGIYCSDCPDGEVCLPGAGTCCASDRICQIAPGEWVCCQNGACNMGPTGSGVCCPCADIEGCLQCFVDHSQDPPVAGCQNYCPSATPTCTTNGCI